MLAEICTTRVIIQMVAPIIMQYTSSEAHCFVVFYTLLKHYPLHYPVLKCLQSVFAF
jgi:hypothetical protein